jgi:serine phosphatase RsbU (regulator of sigma subunit)
VLARAVRLVAGTPDPVQLLRGLASLLVPGHADFCLADLLEPPDLITRVAAIGLDGPLSVDVERRPSSVRRSSARAVGILTRLADAPGQRLLLSGEQLRAMASSAETRTRAQAELVLSLGAEQVLVLGLPYGDDLLGVLSLARGAAGFSTAELRELGDLAALAGVALSNARLGTLQRGMSVALQHNLLPALPVLPGVTLAARFTPAVAGLAVGGDWYDAFHLPGRQLAVVVGDATGHDVHAAVRMAELRNLLRAVAVDQQVQPAGTLARLDAAIDQLAPHLSGTCVYAQLTVGPATTRLEWSSAGHLPPVLFSGGAAELLDTPPDLMLGVRLGTARADHSRELKHGDVIVLYTDGLVEERQALLDERLELLRRRVEELAPQGPELLADRLVSELASGEDDVVVLVVVIDAAADRVEEGS